MSIRSSDADQSDNDGLGGRVMLYIAGISLLLAFIAIASIGYMLFSGGDDTPSDTSVDAGFARDMSEHHAQAVTMAGIVYRRTLNPEIQLIAYDIMTTQQAQIGMMSGWLGMWGLPSGRDGEPMQWMGHNMAGPMPGMATQEQVNSLETLDPAEMDRTFLTLMIEHHKGGSSMAMYAAENASTPMVRSVSRQMATSQSNEVATMEKLLAQLSAGS